MSPAPNLPPSDLPPIPDTVAPGQGARDPSFPSRIGRYRVERLLGCGGFGKVYLAHDDQLHRPVAVKVPHPDRASRPGYAESYLAEARILASLDHPHIVPVHDVGQTDDGLPFVVSKFIAGSDLDHKIRGARLSLTEAVELTATVAEALDYAHRRGLVHRDVKPANILIEAGGKPYVADFGLALREEDYGRGTRGVAGTPAYMSPEQARGEGHRVDGRSDLFSLGVVLYELLTGRRPFHGDGVTEVLGQVRAVDPRPPRQVDDRVSRELERICLKALAKRAADRYATGRDMAEDLRHFLASAPAEPSRVVEPTPAPTPPDAVGTPTPTPPFKIVSKGLRSFDAGDADFFLDLLPGPRDRDGLPESLRFWKTRIEESDPDKTFAVGLVYGPSGCGKSLLMKAGLLPRVAGHVVPVYVEATGEDTEVRLLKGLRKHCPDLPANLRLVEAVAALRRDGVSNKKVLIVLDQFEQWLHARKADEEAELVQCLRQCDGGRVQAVVMVRDDFWMAVTRFLRELEVELVPDRNVAAVDLFDPRHARKVLEAFGGAFGTVDEPASAEQGRFLDQAVAGLAQDDKVISVRLALFAEMVKGKPWTPGTLKAVGGAEGVGVAFLEDTFSAPTANPKHRLHQKAAQAVLKALLPEAGSDIKGNLRSLEDLRNLSGYSTKPRDFEELLHILDGELRLITPTDPEGSDTTAPAGGRYYQLTHDYLVHSLRAWLTRKQKQTRRGRAELRLTERAALWNAKPESRHLPAGWEWLNIRLLTRKRDWSAPQRKMMRKATRYHALRGLMLAACLLLLGWGGWEGFGRLRAEALRHRLLETAATEKVPDIVQEMTPYRRWLDLSLREALPDAERSGDARRQLHASLALLPVDAGQLDYLKKHLLTAEPPEVLAIREALRPHREEVSGWLWEVLEDSKQNPAERLRVACVLAAYAEGDGRWEGVGHDVALALVAQDALVMGRWAEALKPVRRHLLAPLTDTLRDEKRAAAQRGTIARLYADYVVDHPDAFDRLEKTLDEKAGEKATDDERLVLARRQANVAAALAVMGRWEKVLPLLRHGPDRPDPTLRTYLIGQLGALVDARALRGRLDAGPEVSIRRALLLALGDFDQDRLPPAEQAQWMPRLEERYRNDPDAGIHGAAGWLLREWKQQKKLGEIDGELRRRDVEVDRQGRMPAESRAWYVNGEGQTMVIVPRPGEFWMGERHRRRIDRSFALAAREVTVAEFRRFRDKHEYAKDCAPTEDCPVNKVSWYDAAAYCNWLSEKDGIPEDQWCYMPKEKDLFESGMKMAADYLRRTGYRLPTEAEWEYACRAGSETVWSMGDAEDVLRKYAWYNANAERKTHPVGSLRPNGLGLFDLHGNMWELCQDRYELFRERGNAKVVEDNEDNRDIRCIEDKDIRMVRGGAFTDHAVYARSAYRVWYEATLRNSDVGFRPARTFR